MNRKFLKKAPAQRSSNSDSDSETDSKTTPTNPSKSFNTHNLTTERKVLDITDDKV